MVKQIIRKVILFLLAIGLALSLLFIERKYAVLLCNAIEIEIKYHPEQSFLTTDGILDLLKERAPLVGKSLKKIDSYQIKNKLASHPLIKNVSVFKTWNGILKIFLETKHMIARMLDPIDPNGSQVYINENGGLISIKGLPLLRLLIISGNPTKIITEQNKVASCNKKLLELINYIYKDSFFCHQITSLQVKDNYKVILGTQIGGHHIMFGRAENIPLKFEKLRLFYRHIIPYKGWNAYRYVNLAFKNQLICS